MLANESPKELLSRTIATYASLNSYSDTGVVLGYRQGAEPQETTFETAFARPGRFKFSWIAHHPYPPLRHVKWRSVFWANDLEVYIWHMYDEPSSKAQSVASLELAVAGATGVSSGSAVSVATLLMPNIRATSVRDLKDVRALGIEDVDGTPCYHLVGSLKGFGEQDVWIAKTDFLIRKIRSMILDTPYEEIRRNVKYNVSLPSDTFTFTK